MAYTLNDIKLIDSKIPCPLSKNVGRKMVGLCHKKYKFHDAVFLFMVSAAMRSSLYYGTHQNDDESVDIFNSSIADINICKGASDNLITTEPLYSKECCDNYYVHTQVTPSLEWTVNHNLNKMCDTTIVDDVGNEIYADVIYVDLNTIKIKFLIPMTGKVYCN